MKRVFVSGPIKPKSGNFLDGLRNIGFGIRASARLIELGFAPFCPFLDFQYWICGGGEIDIGKIHAVDLAWVEKADAVLALPGSSDSAGAQMEIEHAQKLGIPVFLSIDGLHKWAKEAQ